MRFKLTLGVEKKAFGNMLPINYQYEQSAVIYKILSRASTEYASWLHENGYTLESGKRFKLFTFSRLKIEKRRILQQEEQIKIMSDTVEWQISFLPEKSTENFIQGVFMNQVFEIGNKKSTVRFRVVNIEVLPSPQYSDEMEFTTMSPICLKHRREDGSTEYLSLIDVRAKQAILSGLLSRYEVFHGNPYKDSFNFDFTVLDVPKSVLVTIKSHTYEQTKVRGYMSRFHVKAPQPLMQIMYESGIGEECSQGFGCVGLLKKN